MSLLLKSAGIWKSLEQGSVHLRDGTIKQASQIWAKRSGTWYPIWTTQTFPSAGPQIWGIAQFSDTDFTGGKDDPNQAGDPYERWTGPQDFISSELTVSHDGNGDAVVTMDVPFPEYGYFAHPASMGVATFIDNATGFPGGWDGAGWPDGGSGTTSGPLTVTYDDGSGPKDWYVYRTDYSGIGQMSWTVQF
jgi:hypothetical protein